MEGAEFVSAWWVFILVSVILCYFYQPATEYAQIRTEEQDSLSAEGRLLLIISTFGTPVFVTFAIISTASFLYFSGYLEALAPLILKMG